MVVPLLNEYKYGLFRRRFLQTLLGGPRVRKVPWFVHVFQAVLWLLPLALSIPFIVVSALRLWDDDYSDYYLALIYAVLIGSIVLAEGVIVYIVRRCSTRVTFDDEDDLIEISSCFSASLVDFVFSIKSFHTIFLHPIISVLHAFAACFVLLPNVQQKTLPIGVIVFVSVIGWLTFCNAHYALAIRAPLEVAVYRTTDRLGLTFYHRPTYFILLGAVFIPVWSLVSSPALYLNLLYGAFCLFPLGWVLGVLPPLDALLPWFMERVHIIFLGGSPMATDLRLFVAFSSSVVLVIVGVAIRHSAVSLLLLTAFGYLLSQDIFLYCKALLCLMATKLNNRVGIFFYSHTSQMFSKTFQSYVRLGDFHHMSSYVSCLKLLIADIVRGFLLLAASLVSMYFTYAYLESTTTRDLMRTIFAGVIIFSYVFVFVSNFFQASYLCRILRNPLPPKLTGDMVKVKSRKKGLDYLTLPRKIIIAYLAPLLMVVFVGLSLGPILSSTYDDDDNLLRIFTRILTLRLLRKIWQNTPSALTELMIVSILFLAVPNVYSALLSFSVLTLVVGFSLEVCSNFFYNIIFIGRCFFSFICLRKQRAHICITVSIVISTFLFSPLLFQIVLIASVLSAPILPLFTLPVFLVSYPRPQHFWPSLLDFGRTYLNTDDTIFYEQAELELAKALSRSISRGSISSQPGTQILFRFDNRLALATILEIQHGYCIFNLRGLELMETSCHSEEATKVDNMFEKLHNQNSRGVSFFNRDIVRTLLPSDTVIIHTYSDARNVLTGIIDQPEALSKFSKNLMSTLVWVFYKFLLKNADKDENTESPNIQTQHSSHYNLPHSAPPSPHYNSQRLQAKRPTVYDVIGGQLDVYENIYNRRDSCKLASETSDNVPQPTFSSDGLIPLDLPVSARGSSSMRNNKVVPLSTLRSTKDWEMPPISQMQLHALLRKYFPYGWYSHMNERLSMKKLDTPEFDLLSKVVMGCFDVFMNPSSSTKGGSPDTTPSNIIRNFEGIFSDLAQTNWLTNSPSLMNLALKSYRYAAKLMYDEGSLGEVQDFPELVTYLEEYDTEWCVVSEKEDEWRSAILSNTPHLFSVGHDTEKRTFTAHVLNLQDEVVHVGTFNSPALLGMWANMNFELLYLTNDDEERYSIQAHPYLFRNVSNQLAEPPLGYCVYSSGLITIPST